ncbi:putative m23 peptidase domain-containing protein [Mycobacterium xenopi 3993]|nr:putative m23 peptidase domain-containing protein [Mycobacterium xenopi 3993]
MAAATVIGQLQAGHPGCGAVACLHWGAMWGRRPAPTISTRWGCWARRRSGSSRCAGSRAASHARGWA